IYNITAKAVRGDEESVALQAIEFWSMVCDEKTDILEEYVGDTTRDSDIPCFYFIKQALPALVPMLLETLLKQEEDQDLDEVMPFIAENITKQDWRQREAATYTFGSILEGPSPDKLVPLVNHALPFMLSALVKDPRLRGCGLTSPITPFFQEIVQSLLTVTQREDATESRLRTAAYETLNEVVRCSTDETAPLVLQLVAVIMMELHKCLEAQNLSSGEREKQSELTGLLCGCLQVIIQKLGSSEPTKYVFLHYADHIMGLFIRVFARRNATAHEEAMLAIGALAYAIGPDFAKYLPEFYQFLEANLQNFEDYQVCAVTVGVVGDICRALEDKILPYCDGIMTQLLKNLSSDNLHRSVKPPLFSCIGDIALAIGDNFNKYLTYAMNTLQIAAEMYAHTSGFDMEMTEYINNLRNGILEAYSGIFQGFKNSS
ncbi:importin subunit beta-1-like protein, partial [Trifolium pratense]